MRLTFSPSDSLPVQLLHGDSADGTMLRHTVIIAVKTSELVNINKKCPERIWSFNRATNVVNMLYFSLLHNIFVPLFFEKLGALSCLIFISFVDSVNVFICVFGRCILATAVLFLVEVIRAIFPSFSLCLRICQCDSKKSLLRLSDFFSFFSQTVKNF